MNGRGGWVPGVLIGALLGGYGLTVGAAEIVWRYLPQFPVDHTTEMKWVDLDGDGVNEVVFNSQMDASRLGVLKGTPGGMELVDIHITGSTLEQFQIIPATKDRPGRVLIGQTDGDAGQLQELEGIPLKVARTWAFGAPVVPWAFADVDADGEPEMVVTTVSGAATAIRVIDYATAEQEWSYPAVPSSRVGVAQLDGDVALEVVLLSVSPGLVLSGDDGSIEWSYPGSFGYQLLTGRFGSDLLAPTFLTRGHSPGASVFRSAPYSLAVRLVPVTTFGTLRRSQRT